MPTLDTTDQIVANQPSDRYQVVWMAKNGGRPHAKNFKTADAAMDFVRSKMEAGEDPGNYGIFHVDSDGGTMGGIDLDGQGNGKYFEMDG